MQRRLLVFLWMLSACSDPMPMVQEDASVDADTSDPMDATSEPCRRNADCITPEREGLYCTTWICMPDDAAADAMGCVAQATACDPATPRCDEALDQCVADNWCSDLSHRPECMMMFGTGGTPMPGDCDGDGYRAAECASDGERVDCDDMNPTIHPGATEICDVGAPSAGIDEDCDPTTLASESGAFDGDLDGDGRLNAACCNPQPEGDPVCGMDCDDTTDVADCAALVDLSGGGYHNCIRDSTRAIRCWGENGSGQLGDGTNTHSRIARDVPDPTVSRSGWSFVVTGFYHTCGSTGSSFHCWGDNISGQLGNGGLEREYNTPQRVVGLTNIVAASVGYYHTCVVAEMTGEAGLYCWGHNVTGELGASSTEDCGSSSSPSPCSRTPLLVPGVSNAIGVAAGQQYTCAVLSTGRVQCWGRNAGGQLGDGTTTNRTAPVEVSSVVDATAISAGQDHTCALRETGQISCWGDNGRGQLGDGTEMNRSTPVEVLGITNAIAIAASDYHTCALLRDRTVRCWGNNDNGELGDGTSVEFRNTPVNVTGLTAPVASLGRGGEHTCVMTDRMGSTPPQVWCWGRNGEGQLGTASGADFSNVPVLLD